MPEVAPSDVERALTQWPHDYPWDRQDRADMRLALEADDLDTAMRVWMPFGDRQDRASLDQIRAAHAQGWPGEVPA